MITGMDPFFGYRSLNVGTDNYRSHGMEGPRGGLEAENGRGSWISVEPGRGARRLNT